ncbi:MAG TPA: alpha/beta fold hydrolase [Noviherbaspirillum sp.]|nr:alpha/beta fold hydrolase [Noviherbaspirillum sp.]
MTSAYLLLSLGAGGAILLAVRKMLHRGLAPEATVEGMQPAELGMPAQTVRIPGVRGLQLFAWYIPSQSASPAPAAVLMHGWGGNASTLLPAAQALHRAGYTVLLPESRNHGRSDRDSHSSLPCFAQDMDSALDWLKSQPGVDTTRLVALGHSVGGAAALLSASRRNDLCAVVSVAAFAHPERIMRRWLSSRRIPYWPIGWLINRYVERVIGARFASIAPVASLRRIACPVMLVHGRQDTTVPLEDARLILHSSGQTDAILLVLDGSHEAFADMELAMGHLCDFLARASKLKDFAPAETHASSAQKTKRLGS